MSDKQALRRELRARRKAIGHRDKQAWDAAINRAIVAHPRFQASEVLLGFVPIGTEPDIRPTLEEALRLGKALFLPCCNAETRVMTFRQVNALNELVPGAHRIPEPPPGNSQFAIHDSQLCLVPGLAFDAEGFRLGYGGGYYDRFLASFKGSTMGVCYEIMRQATLPREAHDLAVNVVIMEM